MIFARESDGFAVDESWRRRSEHHGRCHQAVKTAAAPRLYNIARPPLVIPAGDERQACRAARRRMGARARDISDFNFIFLFI